MSDLYGKLSSRMYTTLPNDTCVNIKAAGYPNMLYSFSQFSSAARVIMAGHHQGQVVSIANAQLDRCFAGVEMNLSDYAIDDSKREQDCEILKIIPKYVSDGTLPFSQDKCPKFVVIVRNCRDNTLDYFEINRYHSKVNGYGFYPQLLNKNRIRVGEVIDKDMPITPPPALQGSKYGTGRNINICFATFSETIEDANVISETEANNLAIDRIYSTPITCSKERRPVENNGPDNARTPFPDIGTLIGESGIIHATRSINWMTCTEDTDPERLRNIQPLHDKLWYGVPGGEILDLDFVGKSRLLPAGYEQVQRYIRNQTKFWKGIVTTYLEYKRTFKPTKKMEELVILAGNRLILEGEQLPFLYDLHQKAIDSAEIEHPEKGKLDFLHATITYGERRKFSPGDKLTLHVGGKSVSATVYPDHAMPVDQYGVRAGMTMSMTSLFGRTIFGPYFECGVTRIGEFVRRKVEETNRTHGPQAAFAMATEWMSDYNPNYALVTNRRCDTTKKRKDLVEEIIRDGFYNWIPPFHENFCPTDEDRWNALRNISRWWEKWEVPSSVVTYKTRQRDGSYKEFTTINEVGMGSAYVIHLKHIPRISAPGVASVSHIGTPCASSGSTSTHPVSSNPARLGGDEQRILLMHVAKDWVVRLFNLHGASPIWGTNFVIKSLLNAEKPSAIELFDVPNSRLLSGNVIIQQFTSVSATIGWDLRDTKITTPLPTEGLEDFIDSVDILEEKNTEKVVKNTRGRRVGATLTLGDMEPKKKK